MNSAARNIKKISHYFQDVNPYTTIDSLVKLIDENLYETRHKDIAVLNKPPGFNFLYQDKDEKGLIKVLKLNVCKKLNWDNCFRIPTITNMNQSGLCILVAKTDTRDLILKNFRAFNSENIPFFKFYGISTHIPIKKEGKEVFAISPKENEGSTEFEYYENKNASINERKKRKAIVHQIEHKVIQSDPKTNVSLVEFKTTKNNSDGILIYCAKNLMPILGDHKYSYLVKKIFGKPVYVPDAVKKKDESPSLNTNLIKNLGINEYLTEGIPLHLQLCDLNLEKKLKKQKLVFQKTVPLLPYMEETLFRLNLNLPELEK